MKKQNWSFICLLQYAHICVKWNFPQMYSTLSMNNGIIKFLKEKAFVEIKDLGRGGLGITKLLRDESIDELFVCKSISRFATSLSVSITKVLSMKSNFYTASIIPILSESSITIYIPKILPDIS